MYNCYHINLLLLYYFRTEKISNNICTCFSQIYLQYMCYIIYIISKFNVNYLQIIENVLEWGEDRHYCANYIIFEVQSQTNKTFRVQY